MNELTEFLMSAFEPGQFDRFLRSNNYVRVSNNVSAKLPREPYFDRTVTELRRRGQIDARLFERLQEDLPDRAEEIGDLEILVMDSLSAPGRGDYEGEYESVEEGLETHELSAIEREPPFEYSCFISCFHAPRNEVIAESIRQLHKGLSEELYGWRDERVYFDESRLSSDFAYDEGVVKALCQSACMVVVFMPRYFYTKRHLYCIREYRAMIALEQHRLNILGLTSLKNHGLIVPVVLRGELPSEISSERTVFPFRKFNLSNSDMRKHPKYARRLTNLAQYIGERCEELEALPSSNSLCDDFALPSETQALLFRETIQKRRNVYPLTGHL